jgi:hypothetical protein
MADDYSINATITADASGYESGVKKAQKATKTLSKSISGIVQGLGKSGFVGALGAVGLATNGVTSVLGIAKKAFIFPKFKFNNRKFIKAFSNF